LLRAELDAQGRKSKSWTSAAGRVIGGKPFSRGALYLMLRNHTYRGEIVHQGQSHPGEHPPIIDQPLWDAVQMCLAGNTAEGFVTVTGLGSNDGMGCSDLMPLRQRRTIALLPRLGRSAGSIGRSGGVEG